MPIRPRPHDGESTRGYLMRVARLNGYTTSHTWLSNQRKFCLQPGPQLFALLGLGPDEHTKLVGPLPARFGPWPLPMGLVSSDFNHAHRRWCPLCLAQEPIMLGAWEIKLVCVCSRHSVELVEQCRRCARFQRWAGTELCRCECGASLAEIQPAATSESERRMACLLSTDSSFGSWPDFENLSVAQRHRFVRLLGLLGDGELVSRPGQVAGLHCLGTSARYVMGAVKLLQAWPAHFDAQLEAVRKSADASPSLKRTYGVLYGLLYSELRDISYQFARDAFEDHLHRNWWGMVCSRNGLLKRRTVEQHPRRTLGQLALAANVGGAVLRHLVQGELILADTVTLKSGRRMSTIHEQALPSLVALVDGAVTLSEAACHSVMPERRLRELIKAGVVCPLVSPLKQRAAAWLIPKTELAKLDVHANGCALEGTIAVRDALKYWRLRGSEAVTMIRAVLDHVFVVNADTSGLVPLGLARLERQALKSWLLAFRSAGEKAMSIDEAAAALGIKQQVAYELARRGLLNSSVHGRDGHRALPSDIAVFQRDFVSLASLAKAAKRSPKALLDELETRPVTGPCVDGARQYFYRREDIAREQAVHRVGLWHGRPRTCVP